MSDDIELVRRATEVFNRGDLDTLRQYYTPDLLADAGQLWPAGAVRGVDEVLAGFASIFASFDWVEVVADEYIECAGSVVVPSRWRGTVARSDTVIEQPLIAVYGLREGRIASIRYFDDLNDAIAAAQAEAPPLSRHGS